MAGVQLPASGELCWADQLLSALMQQLGSGKRSGKRGSSIDTASSCQALAQFCTGWDDLLHSWRAGGVEKCWQHECNFQVPGPGAGAGIALYLV